MARIWNNPLDHLAAQVFGMTTDRYKRLTKWIVSGLAAVYNEEGGGESSKEKHSPFSVSTILRRGGGTRLQSKRRVRLRLKEL